MLLFLCLFLWERSLLSLSLTQSRSRSASELIGLGLGEEMIGNISSKLRSAVDGGWRAMEDKVLAWSPPCLTFYSKEHSDF